MVITYWLYNLVQYVFECLYNKLKAFNLENLDFEFSKFLIHNLMSLFKIIDEQNEKKSHNLFFTFVFFT